MGFGAAGASVTLVSTSSIAEGFPCQIIDGGIVALGARADARSAAVDTTAITLMQVAKQMSHLLRGISKPFCPTATFNRPPDLNAYAIGDSISSSTSTPAVISVTVSDVNDDPIVVESILLTTTDTGAVGRAFRAWLFRASTTPSNDNAALSVSITNLLGRFEGTALSGGITGGTIATLVPEAGSRIITLPTTGASTLFLALEAREAFTPTNASSWALKVQGFQGRS